MCIKSTLRQQPSRRFCVGTGMYVCACVYMYIEMLTLRMLLRIYEMSVYSWFHSCSVFPLTLLGLH